MSGNTPAYWPFMAGLGFGFIIGLFMLSSASDGLMQDRIDAGMFDRDGLVYRIELVEQR